MPEPTSQAIQVAGVRKSGTCSHSLNYLTKRKTMESKIHTK